MRSKGTTLGPAMVFVSHHQIFCGIPEWNDLNSREGRRLYTSRTKTNMTMEKSGEEWVDVSPIF